MKKGTVSGLSELFFLMRTLGFVSGHVTVFLPKQ